MTYHECIEYINSIPKFTKKTELSNTVKMLEILGVDRNMPGIIHVAGTNGKGSVCTFIAGILEEAGYRVALFTSPHLVDLEERIQINHHQVSKEEFRRSCEEMCRVSSRMKQEGYLHPAYFEFLFGMAMFLFVRKQVEFIVLETGLGGRLDATNVFLKPLLTVITSVSYDHTEILGDTLEKIAAEKAGIIKENVPVVYWGTEKVVTDKIEETARNKSAFLYKVTKKDYKILKITDKSIDFYMNCGYYENSSFLLPFPAAYQAANGALALKAIEVLMKARSISANIIQRAFEKISWSGRMEEVLPNVFVDGAHNKAGITAFIEAVKGMPQKGERVLLFSVVKEKEFESMIRELCENLEFSAIILTEVEGSRRTDMQLLREEFLRYTERKVVCIADTKEALETGIAWKGEEGSLYCAGSLYLAGQIKAVMRQKNGGVP